MAKSKHGYRVVYGETMPARARLALADIRARAAEQRAKAG